MSKGYCEIHPLYFPQEGPPKGHRLHCFVCLRLYLDHMKRQHEQLILDTEEMRDAIQVTASDELKEQYDHLLAVLRGDNDRGI